MVLKPPIGIDDFREVIEGGCLYVDKTAMIQEVMDTPAKVQLFIRPRRFGKTTNLSMLRYFFDNRMENGARLFAGLAIERSSCFERVGGFPVIFLTFKDLKAPDFQTFLVRVARMMSALFREYVHVPDGLDEVDHRDFRAVINREAGEPELCESLALLMKVLQQHYGRKVVLLIDEYDSPIHEGYAKGFYEDVIEFMRSFLGMALKGNTALEKAVVTGILRVARESIFSDLNNVKVFSLLNQPFSDKFGFTAAEVDDMLAAVGLQDYKPGLEAWYNGYLAGDTVIYNPWSILNFLDSYEEGFQPYWVNTSSNDLIRRQVLNATAEVQEQLVRLLQGETVESIIQEHTVFRDLVADAASLWSFLFFCGYLKTVDKTFVNDRFHYRLALPNTEVKVLFKDIIDGWLRREYGSDKVERLLESLVEGDFEVFGNLLADLAVSIFSYHDTASPQPERVVHAFVLGLVVHLDNRYEIRSNRESGMGRYDLMLRPRDLSDPGIIMEFKTADTPKALEAALDAGLAQIEERGYGKELVAVGVDKRFEIAVAFCGKDVRVGGRVVLR